MHSRGGGVCLYLHSTLQYRIRNDLRLVSSGKLKHSKCNPSRKKNIIHKEINSIFVEIDKKNTATNHNIIVGCIYRPPCYPIIGIDNIYCNIPNLRSNVESGLLHVNIADHKGVFCINNDSELFSSNTTQSKRELKKIYSAI